jgi:predicted nucleic acid-binding protein
VTGFLLDTNILSELQRARPSSSVVAFMQQAPLASLFLSDVVVAEMRFGIETMADVLRRDRYRAWLDTVIRPMFVGRVLALNEDVFLRWRMMKEVGQRGRHTFPEPDLLIAATAAHYGLTVVTRDIEPFERAGVAVINPWRAASSRP